MSDAPPGSTTQPISQPPLGISHLLLWMFGAAVVLAAYRGFLGEEESAPRMQAVMVGNQVVVSLLAGINIAALVVYARRLVVRDAPFPRQPGHWLLVIVGIANLALWVFYGASLGLMKIQGIVELDETIPYVCLSQAAGYSLSAVLTALVAIWIREPGRWRLAFLLLAVSSGFLALTFLVMFSSSLSNIAGIDRYNQAANWYSWLYSADQVVGILLLGFNGIADRADRRPRDWVHKVGLAATIFQSLANLVVQWLLQWAAGPPI